jgi:hypothetical protein
MLRFETITLSLNPRSNCGFANRETDVENLASRSWWQLFRLASELAMPVRQGMFLS